MTEGTASRWVWVALGCITFVILASEALSVEAGSSADPSAVLLVAFPIVGALIASRQPGSAIAWITLTVGIVMAVFSMFEIYALYSLASTRGRCRSPISPSRCSLRHGYQSSG